MINRDAATPPWRQLRDILREKIRRGEITAKLPGERELMSEYELALGTVRKAISALREEGLIETEPGWGSFVKGTRPE